MNETLPFFKDANKKEFAGGKKEDNMMTCALQGYIDEILEMINSHAINRV